MKKISTLLAILLAITMLSGCNSSDNKSLKTSTDNSQTSNLQTFNEVYQAEGLEKSVYYLNDNFDSFTEESKTIYMDSLAKEISARSMLYVPLINLEPVEGPAPHVIENVEWLYQGIYNPETNILYKSKLDEIYKIATKSIEDDNFFILCKKYYAMDGSIEDMGFDIIVKKEIYDILSERYADYTDEPNLYFEFVKSYTDYMGPLDNKLESKETYPVVLVKEVDSIELLRNEWKTEVLLPIKIEEKPSETDAQNVSGNTNQISENKFDVLTIESRMERVLNDINKYTWNIDNEQAAKECFISDLFLMYVHDDSLKEYINETYIYELPSSLDFKGKDDATGNGGIIYAGDTYAYVYESIFGESIKTENTVNIEPCDPPLIDTILVSYEQTDLNSYKIIGAYDATGRIEVNVDYDDFGIVIRSFKRYEEKGNISHFKIEEVKEIPSGNVNLINITNPAYFSEPEENLTSYIFSIEGKYDVIGVFTKKTMDSEEEVYDLDLGGENIVLKYKTMFPTDFSQDTLLIRSAGGTEYKMQLNDSVDRDLYFFEE